MRTTPIIFALLFLLPGAALAAELPDGAAAVVHGETISMDEFRAALVTRIA